VAELNDEILGMALYYMTFSTWRGSMLYLEDFYVSENYRSAGIGQLLFDAYINEAKERGCKMVKWEVLDWNTEAIKFYERNGAVIEKQWWKGKIIF
jgi:GNAT superfamily N-acetyltransferase